MHKTKIICTLGPASSSNEILEELILCGMDAARFNFSHGDHESHLEQLNNLRQACRRLNARVATILDTKGPEIRIRSVEEGAKLKAGNQFVLTTEDVTGNCERASVTYPKLAQELSRGCRILIDDGLIELRVEKIEDCNIVCTVINGGMLSSNKSINVPDVHISLPSLTPRDIEDIKFGVENDFDYIAASFVRRAEDVEDIRRVLYSSGGSHIDIIAKIENREGVDNLDEIIAAADGIMVARGDLGVEIPAFEVPVLQKKMIAKCLAAGKIVIIATQMLDSMIRNPRPTRAEVSDVANAVYDAASCVMLSGETASGKYPVESLKAMVDTVKAAEQSIHYWKRFQKAVLSSDGTISGAISHSCCLTAMDLNAKAIVAATTSGHTARVISRFRPACPILAVTTTERVCRRLKLYWGVVPYISETGVSTDALFDMCVRTAKMADVANKGDTVVITAGVPVGISGTTNLIKAQII